ncbi:MAG: hypothetical protein M1828_003947 [Chrysothrix sp. TS-e1954]|nr:MAG: hypothetical protein M1828_003947 [Chrysothrix sp. TS-e1954]
MPNAPTFVSEASSPSSSTSADSSPASAFFSPSLPFAPASRHREVTTQEQSLASQQWQSQTVQFQPAAAPDKASSKSTLPEDASQHGPSSLPETSSEMQPSITSAQTSSSTVHITSNSPSSRNLAPPYTGENNLREPSIDIAGPTEIDSRAPAARADFHFTSPYPSHRSVQPSYTRSNGLPAHLIALPPLSVHIDLTRDRPLTPRQGSRKTSTQPSLDRQERAGYRLWREGKPVLGGRMMMGAAQDNEQDGIDKKIEATLPRAEQHVNARSRKASHHMGIFREAEPEQDRPKTKKRDDRQSELTTPKDADSIAGRVAPSDSESSRGTYPPAAADQVPTDPAESALPEPGLLGASTVTIATDSKSPQRFVDDTNERRFKTVREDEGKFDISLRPKNGKGKSDERLLESTSNGNDDHETISSAIYWPHLEPKSRTQETEPGLFKERSEAIEKHETPQQPQGRSSSKSSRPRAESNQIELSLQSEDEQHKVSLHGDIDDSSESLSVSSKDRTAESTGIMSVSASESEAENEDILGSTTPRATDTYVDRAWKQPSEMVFPPHAVLKPFSHQVGGHTALYRFSRRAVCKKLNNKENKFYETIERFHDDLLDFLPRYIGVLNVAFERSKKASATALNTEPSNGSNNRSDSTQEQRLEGQDPRSRSSKRLNEHVRIVSHSQKLLPMPEVYLNMNRHIIPDNLFSSDKPSSPSEATLASERSTVDPNPQIATDSQVPAHEFQTLSKSSTHNTLSWGNTIINDRLRAEVMREVFAPPPIQRSNKKGRHRRGSRGHGLSRRGFGASESNATDYLGVTEATGVHGLLDDTYRSQRMKAEGTLSPPQQTSQDPSTTSQNTTRDFRSPDAASRSVSNLQAKQVEQGLKTQSRTLRRRHSGSGLVRQAPEDVTSENKSNLQFFEDAEYAADLEDEVLTLDHGALRNEKALSAKLQESHSVDRKDCLDRISDSGRSTSMHHDLVLDDVPQNPKEARLQADTRVDEFLLLEDLTAGMSNPCSLDLKMGTRQYGIDADQKKQKSQRSKCAATTSLRLGIRVCGMQTYDILTQECQWQDKYFGRDLQAGLPLLRALASFFYNGVDYHAARLHVPRILEKLDALDRKVRSLPGYRFYGSSLYIIYEGTPGNNHATENNGGPAGHWSTRSSDVVFKIIDFANCVTAEETDLTGVECPPSDPKGVDHGYLRGLGTLKIYFRCICAALDQGWLPTSHERALTSESSSFLASRAAEELLGSFEPGDPGMVSS